MDRKKQLKEMIKTGKNYQEQSQAFIRKYSEELGEIQKKETRKPSPQLVGLQQKLEYNPASFKIREELTKKALEEEIGTFVGWRGGQGTPPEAQFVEIEQPLFTSENIFCPGRLSQC